MAGKFCTQCGKRLELEDRFCIYCGASIAGSEAEGGSSSSRTGIAPQARKTVSSAPYMRGLADNAKFPQDDAEESKDDEWEDDQADFIEEEDSFVITEHDLNYMVACSFNQAPLDMNFLLIRDENAGPVWKPANSIQSFENCRAGARAWLYYSIGRKEFLDFYAEEVDRDELSDEALKAVVQMIPNTTILVYLVFEPAQYADLDNKGFGKWVRYVDKVGNVLYKAVLHMPLPGSVLKQRLQKHEVFLKNLIEELRQTRKRDEDDTDEKVEGYEESLENLGKALKRIPDGSINHTYCLGAPAREAIVKLADESGLEGGLVKSAFRAPSAVRAAKALRARNALHLKSRPTGSTIVPQRRTPPLGYPESSTGKAALNRIKKLLRPDS
jgi:hypothetical protein